MDLAKAIRPGCLTSFPFLDLADVEKNNRKAQRLASVYREADVGQHQKLGVDTKLFKKVDPIWQLRPIRPV